jgi:coenzyme F420-reducing hydrogenase delta subunit
MDGDDAMKYPLTMRRALVLPVAVLLLGGMTFVTGIRPAVAQPVTITSTAADTGSSLCIDDPNSSTTANVQLIQYSCNSASNQNWTFTPVSGTTSTYTITSFAGLCVDVSGRSTADNAQVIQYTCNGQTNQQFNLVPVTGASDTFSLTAVHSGKCIVPTGDTTANDTVLVQLPCTSAATREWRLPSFNGGSGGGGGGGFSGLP